MMFAGNRAATPRRSTLVPLRRGLAAIAIGAALAAAPVPARAQEPCPTCESTVTALTRQVEVLRQELDRLLRDMQREQGDSAMRKALDEMRATRIRLEQAERALARAVRPREPTTVAGVAPMAAARQLVPTGYLGVTISNAEHLLEDGRLIAYYSDYPVVESVEPGSPAEKAGIQTGDVLLAYNGDELRRRKVVLGEVLKPGSKVVVRVRRSGDRKDITVTVGRRPGGGFLARTPTPPEAPLVHVPPFEIGFEFPETPRAPAVYSVVTGWGEGLAGADLTASTPELAQFFGRADGVVVLKVASGTPAARAGLQVGDVITRAGTVAVERPVDLQRALVRYAERKHMELQLWRRPAPGKDPERKTVELRW